MRPGALGKVYHDGEVIIRQGEAADGMFVILEGRVEILSGHEGQETRIRIAGEGELIGEIAVFDRQVRSATVRALGEARLLTVDLKNFFRRINEDPSLAFRLVETMSRRIRELTEEVVRLKASLGERSTR